MGERAIPTIPHHVHYLRVWEHGVNGIKIPPQGGAFPAYDFFAQMRSHCLKNGMRQIRIGIAIDLAQKLGL
jgi:hypothetical protein